MLEELAFIGVYWETAWTDKDKSHSLVKQLKKVQINNSGKKKCPGQKMVMLYI